MPLSKSILKKAKPELGEFVRERVLNFLKRNSKNMYTIKEIAKETGGRENSVSAILRKFLRAKKLKKFRYNGKNYFYV